MNDFWKNKKVLLTGHTGFKGSWLSIWLKARGAQITGLSLSPPTQPNLFELAKVHKNMTSLEGDIRDLKAVENALKKSSAEIVIHMAAQSVVKEGYILPLDTFSTNIMGTVNILEAARKFSSVKCVLIISTDKCYENHETLKPYDEKQPLGGFDPYSASKVCSEYVTLAYRHSFFENRRVASARAGNVIGGGDWSKHRLVPDLIRALLKREKARIRNPHSVRPWQHVLDCLSGYLNLCEKIYSSRDFQYADAWNFGPSAENAVAVSSIADQIVSLWGSGGWTHALSENEPKEVIQLRLDSSKAKDFLEWSPKLNLSKSLEWVVDWHKACAQNDKMDLFTLKQIEKFETL